MPESVDTTATADIPRSPSGASLRVESVRKVFRSEQGEVEALSSVSVQIEPGEFVSILGPSGCGKTTLMSLMTGLDAPTSGEVFMDDQPVTSPVTTAGVVFQRDLLLDWRTCLKNILLQFEMRGESASAHVDEARELLAMVGMSEFENSYPWQLSGGMRQRVAICRALAHKPRVLFMDEPFGALDAITRDDLNSDLARLSAETNATVVFVTHSIGEAVFLSDRVLMMSRRPARVVADISIDIPRPRSSATRIDSRFTEHVAELRQLLEEHGGHGG